MSEQPLLDVEAYLADADSILNMFQHPGWKVLMDEAQAKMTSYGRALVYENDEGKTKRLQANMRALDFLVSFPKEFVEAANEAKRQADESQTGTTEDAQAPA